MTFLVAHKAHPLCFWCQLRSLVGLGQACIQWPSCPHDMHWLGLMVVAGGLANDVCFCCWKADAICTFIWCKFVFIVSLAECIDVSTCLEMRPIALSNETWRAATFLMEAADFDILSFLSGRREW
jgi:hypothetical protein